MRYPSAKQNGTEWTITCPFCGKANHCSINPWKNRYYCFKCSAGRGSSAMAMIQDLEKNTSRDQLDYSRFDVNDFIPMLDQVPVMARENILPDEYQALFPLLRDAEKSPLITRAIAYLRRRRITDAMLIHYRIGVCLDGKYARRVIVPIVLDGNPVSFVARLFLAPGMRYLTPPREEIKIPPAELLFNWDQAKSADPIKITEGVFDAMALGSDATSLLGKSLHQGQRMRLGTVMPKHVEIWLDPDAWKDALLLMTSLREIGATVALMRLRDGDPSETGGANAERHEIDSLAESFLLRWNSETFGEKNYRS